MIFFDLYKIQKYAVSRKPIKERGIKWEESYEERSVGLKKRMDKKIGYGAYRRWTGYDSTTNSDYYVVVGPSIQKGVGKMWFAGIKKLSANPVEREKKKNYSPYGEYFPNIIAAQSHANRRWGVPMPDNQINYTKDDLTHVDIPKHVKA